MSGPIDRGRAAVRPVAFGFLMGMADLVPGVSGGTIALLLGIYDRLVASIRAGAGALAALVSGDLAGVADDLHRVEWRWLLLLLSGIGAAVVLLASGLERLLETNPVELSAGFAGLVIGSIVVTLADVDRWDRLSLALLVGVAAVFFVGLGLRPGTIEAPSLPIFFAAGALAICAMILPGVSGSFLLLTVGMYEPVIGAISDRELVIAAAVAGGAVVGLGSFSTLLSWVLRRWHDRVLAVLIGLMAGSLRVLWPWPAGPDGVGDTGLGAPVTGDLLITVLLAVAGVAFVVVIARLARGATPAHGPA